MISEKQVTESSSERQFDADVLADITAALYPSYFHEVGNIVGDPDVATVQIVSAAAHRESVDMDDQRYGLLLGLFTSGPFSEEKIVTKLRKQFARNPRRKAETHYDGLRNLLGSYCQSESAGSQDIVVGDVTAFSGDPTFFLFADRQAVAAPNELLIAAVLGLEADPASIPTLLEGVRDVIVQAGRHEDLAELNSLSTKITQANFEIHNKLVEPEARRLLRKDYEKRWALSDTKDVCSEISKLAKLSLMSPNWPDQQTKVFREAIIAAARPHLSIALDDVGSDMESANLAIEALIDFYTLPNHPYLFENCYLAFKGIGKQERGEIMARNYKATEEKIAGLVGSEMSETELLEVFRALTEDMLPRIAQLPRSRYGDKWTVRYTDAVAGADHDALDERLANWLNAYNGVRGKAGSWSLQEYAYNVAKVVGDFLEDHPFFDGNGRLGIVLTELAMREHSNGGQNDLASLLDHDFETRVKMVTRNSAAAFGYLYLVNEIGKDGFVKGLTRQAVKRYIDLRKLTWRVRNRLSV